MPVKAGNFVRLINHPPKCAHKLSNISWKSFPFGGAAVDPTIDNTIHHVSSPISVTPTTLENCLYVGKNGCGHNFGQNGGYHDGRPSSSDLHFRNRLYHHDLESF